MAFVPYKGILQSDGTPTGAAGIALEANWVYIADTLESLQGSLDGLGTMADQNANAVNIDGGTIDGTTIGATTPAAAQVSDLQVKNAADADMWLDLKAGLTADYRAYIAWWEYTGAAHKWLMGRNAENNFILFDADDSLHRLIAYHANYTTLDSYGNTSVRINAGGDANSGTGGLAVWSGGATPKIQHALNSSGLTVYAANGINPGILIDSENITMYGGVAGGLAVNTIVTFDDRGANRWFLGKHSDNNFKLYNYGTTTYVMVVDFYTNAVSLGGELAIPSDTVGVKLGAGQDASIYYDGANLQVNPKVVGSGGTQFNGGVGIGVAPGDYPLNITQAAGWYGITLQDSSGNVGIALDGNGNTNINANQQMRITGNSNLILSAEGGYLGLYSPANTGTTLLCGALWSFADVDDFNAVRLTINSATGELAIPSDTVGVKLGAGGDASIYYDGTDLVIDPDVVGTGGVKVGGKVAVRVASTAYPLYVPWASGDAATTLLAGSTDPANNQVAIQGTSYSSYGVYGSSTASAGVMGTSATSYGVCGISTDHYGVYGSSTKVAGVAGTSSGSYGVYGNSTHSYAGMFYRNTATPSGAVPVFLAWQDHASDPNPAARFVQDGTGLIADFMVGSSSVAQIANTGQLWIVSDTVGLKLGASGAASFYSDDNYLISNIGYQNAGTLVELATKNKSLVYLKDGTKPYLIQNTHIWEGGAWATSFGYGLGYYAIENNSGFHAVGIGYDAANYNIGDYCVAVGTSALSWNNDHYVTGVGYAALSHNQGFAATALGFYAGNVNVGASAVLVGMYAGFINCGGNLVAVGYSAGQFNQGISNTALGVNALNTFYTNAAGAKTFDAAAVNPTNDRITIAGHGFGATNAFVILKYTEGTDPIGGLTTGTNYQVKIIDADTIGFYEAISPYGAYRGTNITSAGSGTGHKLTPQYTYTNVTCLGAETQATQSNQVVLGDSNVTQVKTYGEITIPSDSYGLKVGAGGDARIYYDGSYLQIIPDVVGSGYANVQGSVRAECVAVGSVPSPDYYPLQSSATKNGTDPAALYLNTLLCLYNASTTTNALNGILFTGLDTGPAEVTVAGIAARMSDRTSGTVDGDLLLITSTNNTPTTKVIVGSTDITVNTELSIPSDSVGLKVGAGGDATIIYNGTDLLINPKVVGSGKLDVQGTLQTDGYNSSDGTAGATADVDVAKVGGGTRTLHFKSGLYTGYTDS